MAWGPECVVNNVATLKGFECVFRNILNIITPLAVLAVFAMLVLGGFQYLTAGEDPKALESAKKTLSNAVLGLVVLIGVWLILKFVRVFTGINVTQLVIPSPGP